MLEFRSLSFVWQRNSVLMGSVRLNKHLSAEIPLGTNRSCRMYRQDLARSRHAEW
jgi:hypothetical protein